MDLLIFVIALSILVLVHELGHYLAARMVGVKVEEFGLGLPPRIMGKKIGQTIWSLNWLPIGGFCKLYGEDSPSPKATEERGGDKKINEAFFSKKPWQKMVIVVGGVVMNVVLALVIFSTVYTITGVPEETLRVKIQEVAKGSPAEKAGLKENDWIKAINGIEVKEPDQLTVEASKNKGKKVDLEIETGETHRDVSVQIEVRENPPAGEGSMGVIISNVEIKKIKWYEFYKGIGAGFKEAYYWGKVIFEGVGKMLATVLTGKMPKDMAGVVGMYRATSAIRNSQGMLAVLHFFGIISVNLAVVNVLPFPALDGGRIVFVIYEMIFRKRANEKFETVVNNLGMAVLLTLIAVITVGDVVKLIDKQ